MVFGPEKNFGQIGQKNGQKLFSGPKKGPNSGFWPRGNFRLNWSKNGQNMVKSCFLDLKWEQIVVFGQEKNFSQIGQKMAEKWPKVVFWA